MQLPAPGDEQGGPGTKAAQTGINLAAALARLSHSHKQEEAKDSAHRDAQVAFCEEPERTTAAAGRCQTGLGSRCSL